MHINSINRKTCSSLLRGGVPRRQSVGRETCAAHHSKRHERTVRTPPHAATTAGRAGRTYIAAAHAPRGSHSRPKSRPAAHPAPRRVTGCTALCPRNARAGLQHKRLAAHPAGGTAHPADSEAHARAFPFGPSRLRVVLALVQSRREARPGPARSEAACLQHGYS